MKVHWFKLSNRFDSYVETKKIPTLLRNNWREYKKGNLCIRKFQKLEFVIEKLRKSAAILSNTVKEQQQIIENYEKQKMVQCVPDLQVSEVSDYFIANFIFSNFILFHQDNTDLPCSLETTIVITSSNKMEVPIQLDEEVLLC